MKTTLKWVKASLAVLWLSIISFPSKVISQMMSDDLVPFQTKYWVQQPVEAYKISVEPISTIIDITKRLQVLLVVIVFIVWIVNFVKIRKIDDKSLRKKKIRKMIMFMLIILLIILLLSLWIRLINR